MKRGRALSQVIGTVLFLAITLVLASLILVLLGTFEPPTRAPVIGSSESFVTVLDNDSGEVYQYMNIRSLNGETVNADEIDIIITAGGERFDTLPRVGNTTSYAPGSVVQYNLTDSDVCGRTEASRMRVLMVHEPSEQVISQKTVDIKRGANISVSEGKVGTDVPYVARIELIGTAASALSGNNIEPDLITSRIVLDNGSRTVLTPWPDNDAIDAIEDPFTDDVNDGRGPERFTYVTDTLDEDTDVTLELRSYKPSDWFDTGVDVVRGGSTYDIMKGGSIIDDRFWVDTSDPSEGNIVLLRDGETVPAFGTAGGHQPSLEDILEDRIGSSGQLSLANNEVVVLFELTDPDAQPEDASGSGNPDYNDAVGLITIIPQQANNVDGTGSSMLLCPE